MGRRWAFEPWWSAPRGGHGVGGTQGWQCESGQGRATVGNLGKAHVGVSEGGKEGGGEGADVTRG